MLFRQLFDSETSTYTYLVADQQTKEAALIDPVLSQTERDLNLIKQLGLSLRYCLETHVHADHITGTAKLRELTGCLGVVPSNADVSCADRRLQDQEVLSIGDVEIQAIATPGHTDSHMAYLANRTHLFTGDALLIRGCGRTDFQSGSAVTLYESVTQRLFKLPDATFVYPGHDYRGMTVSTIAEEKQWNPRFAGLDINQFVDLMGNLNLPNPRFIMEAVPANLNCGKVKASVSA